VVREKKKKEKEGGILKEMMHGGREGGFRKYFEKSEIQSAFVC